MVNLLCWASFSLLGGEPVKTPTVDLLLFAAFILARQEAVKASCFDSGLGLSVKHRQHWMKYLNNKNLANKNKVAPNVQNLLT